MKRPDGLGVALALAGTILLLILAVLLLALAGQAAPPADRCGVWRWPVKTLSDPRAGSVDVRQVEKATVARLRKMEPPETLRTDTPRLWPVEFTVFRIRARLVEHKRESDRDFHVVVADPDRPRLTMIVEVVDTTCPGARDSPYRDEMAAARSIYVKYFGTPGTARFTRLTARPLVTLTGVGFWDAVHGQKGVAPNGIELHPVLEVNP